MARRVGSDGAQTAREMRAAALRLFADRGYDAVSMRQIARDIGVQVGALYLYTPDKQSLLAGMMIEHHEGLLAAWQAEQPPDPSPRARLEAFVCFHIRQLLPRPDAVFVAQMELRSLTPENRARVERLRRLYENILEEILHDGVAAGVFRLGDPRVGTLAIVAMLDGITGWYRAGGRLHRDRIEQIYCALALGAVGASG